jgi:ferredoxin-NADP reductase
MENFLTELKIVGLRDETHDTRSFILDTATGRNLAYQAGQFLTLVFPERNSTRRSYSISSTPYLSEPLTITVKRIANGEYSRYLLDYRGTGSSLYTIGASGFFVLPPKPDDFNAYVFYAAGSGITPVFPLIKTILGNYPSVKVFLSYSNHTIEETIFLHEIRALEKKYPEQLHVEWLFSNAKHLLKARLTKSLVADQVNGILRPFKDRMLIYLCGPHSYMQMISITLLREGVSSEQIRKEIFDTIKPVIRELPPDTEAHEVIIYLGGETHRLIVKYPETILSKAKQAGLLLPYSCEAGKCGTCAATCLKGEVWMSNNEVLLDRELREGRVLTCTGHPIGGDVVIDYQTKTD